MVRPVHAVTAVLVLICAAPPASALQYEVSDGETGIAAGISSREITRIALRDDRIAGVVGRRTGFSIEHDTATGDMFLVPHQGAALTEPVNLFLSAESGAAYQLLLTPLDIPSEQIIIIGRKRPRPARSPAPRREALADLVRAMMTGRVLEDYTAAPPRPADLDHIASGVPEAEIVEVRQGAVFRGLRVLLPRSGVTDPGMLAPGAAAVWLSQAGDEAVIVIEAGDD